MTLHIQSQIVIINLLFCLQVAIWCTSFAVQQANIYCPSWNEENQN